jgi:hypothetical protein
MSSTNDVVRCTVRDGELWMHLDYGSLKIPSKLLKKSQILMDALSAAHFSATRKVTVAAPGAWLHAWLICYGDEDSLSCDNLKYLVNCLLVCFFLCSTQFPCRRCCVHSVASAELNTSRDSDASIP